MNNYKKYLSVLIMLMAGCVSDSTKPTQDEMNEFQVIATLVRSYRTQAKGYPDQIGKIVEAYSEPKTFARIIKDPRLIFNPHPKNREELVLFYNGTYIRGKLTNDGTISVMPKTMKTE